ncbi:beta-N-acetylhexosaminidase [Flavivirga spongiicola]|uniref:beta-N-acetylhexosaminidase n=1 Tax=Flavivirga spongiicola TaxID=421621 RepID=A0ABU7XNT4_9FLAO|nr:beta-N-acetylhexosaminidase [Flavivirga sp. MEBiC05379]MDO5977423.1 beta-N-acetylhexosaminidase [Flavivirga sp. MEBiC05379]
MRSIFYLFIFIILVSSCSEKNKTFLTSEVTLLPKPTTLTLGEESFAFKEGYSVSIESDEQKSAANYLINLIKNTTGFQLELKEEGKALITFSKVEGLEAEGYQLDITPKQIVIKASDAAGYFYGVQSIQQLLSKEVSTETNKEKWLVPSVVIEDAPRFKWRAYMLDESRYFHGETFVKQMLDQMALLKMNVFHWHLIDDAGWRIEIKKYPLLTEVGSKRADSEIETWKSGKTSGVPHSGFYTQEQIKDIVAYAAERNITVVPEFEMPGHSSAAIASYTWLGTAGKDIDVPIKFGRLYDNYDVTKPEVIQFIKDVLTEMFALFPSEVIHIGGDEVGYKVWEESASVQKYMKENGIKTPADLQIDFTNKISQFMEQNGRRMMGWNEIMGVNIHKGFEEKKDDKAAETELAKNVVVHFWKGNLALAQDAAKKGYGIVNSLHSNTYLDYSYKGISLKKAYNFNPIPEGLEEKYHKNIYGLGCQMWSEWTPTNPDVERQTFPRIAAYAEVGWTQLENKDYESFKVALKKIQKHWDSLNINYFKDYEKVEAEIEAARKKKAE